MLALKGAGIPTVVYDSSQTDPRDFDLVTATDQVDSLFENLGLTRLEDREVTSEARQDTD
jgi:hypothetical protein